ncbi:MAG: 4Fe-4S ferredoxin iron-sulfur binding domain-containing protein [Anaerolineaceae bacterium]|nr:MAG: 4Fe-4S ferredoxin iron-sulfur binding domain-containing protein [Anaerolineaceae bacterium]
MDIYTRLAQALDSLPNRFPSTGDGSELRLLAKLFTPEDAELAVRLSPDLEPVEAIAARTGLEAGDLRSQLKKMARRGLIAISRTEDGLAFGLMPFVVGIYEMQVGSMDEELARLVEDYFQEAFGEALKIKPPFHRVIPVGESVRNSMEIHPYESASALVNAAQAWGVLDCICRKQKALIGEPCGHPLDVCMAFGEQPGAFDNNPVIRAVSREESLATLERAAKAGLVHSVSNSLSGIQYICNCCTCSCGILRGMASLGMANVIARSAFVNTVDDMLCNACGTCVDSCQFDALKIEDVLQINPLRCVGCGVCVAACPSEALALVRRPEEEIMPIPETPADWRAQRSAARGLKS